MGIRPRFGVRNGYLPAIGKTGFEASAGLAVDDGHLMAGFGQVPRTADANDAGAQNQNSQKNSYSCSRTMRTTSLIRRKPRINTASCVRPVT